MLVSDVVNPVSTKIDNGVSKRFDDAVIIETINECLRELAIHTNIYTKTATANLVVGTAEYAIPTPLIDIRYAYFSSRPVPILTATEMDIKYPNWRDGIEGAKVYAIAYDEGSKFTIYPSVLEDSTIELKGSTVPQKVTALTDTIDVKNLYLNILIYYVAGTLLTNSGRTEDISRASGFLKEYERRLKLASNNITVSSSKDVTKYTTPFN